MKIRLILIFFVLCCSAPTLAQPGLISIDPDSAIQGQTLTTTVTGSGLNFLTGSPPTNMGNLYMIKGGYSIYPNYVTVLSTDIFIAQWSFPYNAPVGNYDVTFEYQDPMDPNVFLYYNVPGGFNVLDCQIPQVNITAGSTTTFCSGDSVLLYTNSIPGVTYQWYRGTQTLTGANDSAFYAKLSGQYRLKISNASGCIEYSQFISVVANYYPAAWIVPYGSTTFCLGSSVTLLGNGYSTGPYQYQWYKYGNLLPGATTQNLVVTTNGKFKVEVTLNGCTTKSEAVITTVIANPSAIITPQSSTTFCKGDSVVLSANGGSGYTYTWYKYGNLLSGVNTQSITVKSNGKYKVLVTNSNGCSKKSAPVETTSLPLPPAQITALGPVTFCDGDSVILSANTGAGYTYQWKRFSNLINGATDPDYTVKTYGKYKALVYDSNGCVRASNPIIVDVPCRLSKNTQQTIGSAKIYIDSHRLYVDELYTGPVEIFNTAGILVKATRINSTSGIDLSTLPNGLYMAIIRADSKTIPYKFFIAND